MTVDPQLDIDGVAAHLGVTRGTWLAQRANGSAPDPDGKLGRSPWWYASTIDAWRLQHPARAKGAGRPRSEHNRMEHTMNFTHLQRDPKQSRITARILRGSEWVGKLTAEREPGTSCYTVSIRDYSTGAMLSSVALDHTPGDDELMGIAREALGA